jgi:hypothetical protein
MMRDMTDVPATSVLDALAAALSAARGDGILLEAVDLPGRARLLRIARDVAHATERQNAPLAAYLIGRFVQERVRDGISESQAVEEAADVVRSIIGEVPD